MVSQEFPFPVESVVWIFVSKNRGTLFKKAYQSSLERSSEKSQLRISSDTCELFGERENDGLVRGSGSRRCRILMLGNSCNFWIGCGLITNNTGQSNFPSVSLEGSVAQRISHTSYICNGFGIGESLISGSLVKTIKVGERSSSTGCSGVAKETEDWVTKILGVADGETDSNSVQKSIVRMLLGDLSLMEVHDGTRTGVNILCF